MPVATCQTLPPPPPGKTGWPWTVDCPAFPPQRSDGTAWRRISIVTPSFNQGMYLEETIRSILLQGYPNLEYIVIDGASRDNTRDVIQKYERFLSYWTSEKDRGQADAINKGFRRTTGDWIGWQNSDDFYQPNALSELCTAADDNSISVLYGRVNLVDQKSEMTGEYPTGPFDLHAMFPWPNMFNQSMFFHRRVLEAGHLIDDRMHHYLDHDYFWRLIFAGFKFEYAPGIGSSFRIHEFAKGATQHELAALELHGLYKKIYGQKSLPQSVRREALESLRGNCVNQFGKSRWNLFKQFTHDPACHCGNAWRGRGG